MSLASQSSGSVVNICVSSFQVGQVKTTWAVRTSYRTACEHLLRVDFRQTLSIHTLRQSEGSCFTFLFWQDCCWLLEKQMETVPSLCKFTVDLVQVLLVMGARILTQWCICEALEEKCTQTSEQCQGVDSFVLCQRRPFYTAFARRGYDWGQNALGSPRLFNTVNHLSLSGFFERFIAYAAKDSDCWIAPIADVIVSLIVPLREPISPRR